MCPVLQQTSELVERVRNQAASAEPAVIRRAFATELRSVSSAYANDPQAEAWSAWANGNDVIGDAYELLLKGAERRSAGQFQTPTWAADLMARWLLTEPCGTLLDPGVGAGRLLFRTAELDGEAEHAPEQMMGLDVDPVSLEMARLNLLMRGVGNVTLSQRNFLLDRLSKRPDAVICNPPYSRHHSVPAAEKQAIHAGFEARLGLRLSRLAGLHVLFLVRALEVVRKGGRLAFITPAEWLDVNYGREIKRFVLEHAQIEAMVLLKDDHLLFDGALTTAAITFIRADTGSSEPTKVVHMPARLPAVERALAAVNGEAQGLRTEEVRLTDQMRWSRPVRRRASRGVPLAELASIRRGVATGCNRFFVVSEQIRRKRGLKRSSLLPCVTSPRLISGNELTAADLENMGDDVPRWLLNERDPAAEAGEDAIGRFLRWGKRVHKAHRGYLANTRTPWYALEQRAQSPILFTYMNRDRGRFIRNSAGAVPLNTFLIVEPGPGVDADELWALLLSPHIERQVRQVRRNYGGGLWKVEPRELGQVRVRFPQS
jgi:adenine-specific DNA-methyltransferase